MTFRGHFGGWSVGWCVGCCGGAASKIAAYVTGFYGACAVRRKCSVMSVRPANPLADKWAKDLANWQGL